MEQQSFKMSASGIDLGSEMLFSVRLGFSGTVSDQFDFFASNQDHGVTSRLLVDDNELCGPLPGVFYDLLVDSHYFVYDLDASRNHFRCAPSGANEYFESWAHTLAHDFGKCTPVAVPRSVAPARGDPVVMPGNDVDVLGAFVATTEATCKFEIEGRVDVVPAFFVDEETLRCGLPLDWPATQTAVTVAHYCEDYASAQTLKAHDAVTFLVANATAAPTLAPFARPTAAPVSSMPSTAAPSYAEPEDTTEEILSTAALSGVVVAGVVAIGLCAVLFFVIRRELAGKPLFTPVPNITNPLISDDAAADVETDDDDLRDDDAGPPRYAPSHRRLPTAPTRDVELTADVSDVAIDTALAKKDGADDDRDVLL